MTADASVPSHEEQLDAAWREIHHGAGLAAWNEAWAYQFLLDPEGEELSTNAILLVIAKQLTRSADNSAALWDRG